MGDTKDTTSTNTSATTQATPTAEETALNQSKLRIQLAAEPGTIATNTAGLNLTQAFLQGQDLPGYFKGLPSGISEDTISGLSQDALKDLNTQLALSGAGSYMESGASQAIGAKTAGEIRLNAEEYNQNLLLNLLNLATGSSAQIQSPTNQTYSTLASSLAGLRSTTSSGTSTNTTSSNPFLKSFYSGLGTSLGGGSFGAMKFGA